MMDMIAWIRQIRSELKCGVVQFEALQNAVEITLGRYVDGELHSMVERILFDELDEAGDVCLELVVSQFKAKFPQLKY